MSYQISRRKFHQNLRRIHQNLRSWSQKSDQEFWFLKQKFPFVDTKFEHTSLRQARGKRRPQAVARACPRRVCSTRSCDSFNTQFFRARKKREKNSRRAKRGKNSRRASQKFYSLSIFSTHLIQDSTSGVTQQDGGHVGHIPNEGERERGREQSETFVLEILKSQILQKRPIFLGSLLIVGMPNIFKYDLLREWTPAAINVRAQGNPAHCIRDRVTELWKRLKRMNQIVFFCPMTP